MGDIMNQTVMVDTDILIDAGLGVPEATTCLQLLEHNACLAVSVIAQMELMVGGGNKKEWLNANLRDIGKMVSRKTAK